MKKALVSTLEKTFDYSNQEIGLRVCDIANQTFDVHQTLFWVDCDDEALADLWYYNTQTQQVEIKPVPPQPEVENIPQT